MRTKRRLHESASCFVSGAAGLACLALGVVGCGLPEYRLNITQLPPGTASIEGAVFLTATDGTKGTLLSDHFSLNVGDGKTSASVTVNLTGKYDQHKQANFGVIARNASRCVIGTGSVMGAESSTTVGDIEVRLDGRLTTLAAGTTCEPKSTEIVSVERQEDGLYGQTKFQLRLRGWGLSPDDKIEVRSQRAVSPCGGDKTCEARCPTTPPGTPTGTRTNCLMVTRPIYESPTKWMIELPNDENSLASSLSEQITVEALAQFRVSPFCVYLTPAGKTGALLYREQDTPTSPACF